MAKAKSKILNVTLVRSLSKRMERQRACARGLGLRRMHQTVQVQDTPENRGMIDKIGFMLKVEEA